MYKNDEVAYFVDGLRPEMSNWLRFLNCPNYESQENVVVHLCYGKIFYRTTKDIIPGQELFIFYGEEYAEILNIDLDKYYDLSVA